MARYRAAIKTGTDICICYWRQVCLGWCYPFQQPEEVYHNWVDGCEAHFETCEL